MDQLKKDSGTLMELVQAQIRSPADEAPPRRRDRVHVNRRSARQEE